MGRHVGWHLERDGGFGARRRGRNGREDEDLAVVGHEVSMFLCIFALNNLERAERSVAGVLLTREESPGNTGQFPS